VEMLVVNFFGVNEMFAKKLFLKVDYDKNVRENYSIIKLVTPEKCGDFEL